MKCMFSPCCSGDLLGFLPPPRKQAGDGLALLDVNECVEVPCDRLASHPRCTPTTHTVYPG